MEGLSNNINSIVFYFLVIFYIFLIVTDNLVFITSSSSNILNLSQRSYCWNYAHV